MGIGCVKTRRRPGCVGRGGCLWICFLKLLQTSFFQLRQSEPSHIPPGSLPRNPRLTQSSAVRCGLPFPGIAFGLLTPSLDATSPLLKFLNLFEKLRPKYLASPVFCSRCSVAFFPGTPHVGSG